MAVTETPINYPLWLTHLADRQPNYADIREWKGKAASDLSRLKDFLATIIDPRHAIWTELDRMRTLENHNGLELRATQPAYQTAHDFLEYAVQRMYLPLPEFTPDGEGGIDIEWERNGNHLALNCGSLGTGNFISWREPNSRYEGSPATNELLIEKLEWLTS